MKEAPVTVILQPEYALAGANEVMEGAKTTVSVANVRSTG